MTEAVLQEVETYIFCIQNTAEQFIATRHIMDLCLMAERRPGPWVSRRWWEQDRLDVEGMRTADWRSEMTEGGEDIDGMATYMDDLLGGSIL